MMGGEENAAIFRDTEENYRTYPRRVKLIFINIPVHSAGGGPHG